MALNAGSVEVTLSGRFSPVAFAQYDAAMKRSAVQSSAFEKGMVASSGRSSRAMAAMGTVAKTGALAGIAALGYGAVKAVQTFASFEKQMNAFRAVSAATAADVSKAEKQIRTLGVASGLGATKVAQAATELAKGGLSIQQIIGGGLKAATDLAVAGELELADAATYTANALNLFGLKGKDAGKVADALAMAANSTTADIADFGVALGQGGSAAKAAGLSFNETMVALEALAAIGVKNSDAGTSLKAALVQLVKPTDQQAEAAKKAGIAFFDQEGKMKSLTSISEMLRDKTDGMTKKQRLALFATIAGTDGMRTLLSLYDAGPKKLDQFSSSLSKQGTASEQAKKRSEGLSGSWNKLKATGQEALLQIGEAMAPGIGKAVDTIAKKMQEWQKDGTMDAMAEQFGAFADAVATVTPVVIDLLELLTKIGAVKLDAVGTWFGDVGKAIGDGLSFAVDKGIGSISMFINALIAMAGAYNAVAGKLGAPKIDMSGLEAAAAKIDGIRAAMRGVPDQKTVTVDARTGDALQKIRTVGGVMKALPAKTLTNIEASPARAQGTLARFTGQLLKFENAKTVAKIIGNSKNAEQATDRVKAELKRIKATKTTAKVDVKTGEALVQIRDVAGVLKKLPKETRTKIEASDEGAKKKLDGLVKRLLKVENAKTVAKIIGNSRNADQAADRVRAELRRLDQTRVEVGIGADTGPLYAEIRRGMEYIRGLTPAPIPIFGDWKGVRGKPKGKASGRGGRDGREDAIIGEGRGSEYRIATDGGPSYKTHGPELAGLFPGDYIVPTEPAYRSRAVGLWMMAGRDLGIPGYAKGKKGKKKKGKGDRAEPPNESAPRYKPQKIEPLSLPVGEFEQASDRARGTWEQAVQTLKDLREARRTPGRENKRRRADALRDIPKAEQAVRDSEADWRQRQTELTAAKKYAGRIREQEDEAELSRQGMELADRQDNQKAYDQELGGLRKALERWGGLIGTAMGKVPKDSDYYRELSKAARQIGLQYNEAGTAQSEQQKQAADDAKAATEEQRREQESAAEEAKRAQEQEAERFASTGLTTVEEAGIDEIDTAIALAELTAATDDDKAQLERMVAYREDLLSRVQGRPEARPTAIAAAARAVKSSRDALASLTSGTGGGADADLQAQLTQANERTRVAQAAATIADQSLRAFAGPGDIGAGGSNAMRAAGGMEPQLIQNNYMLHPSDPKVLEAIGSAATSGMSFQGSVSSSRTSVGP